MSIKLYEGYRIKGLTKEEFIKKYKNLKKVVEEKSKIKIKEEISNIFYESLDNGFGYQKDERTVLEYVKDEIKEEIENLEKGYRTPSFDKDASFSLKEYKGDLYLYLFLEDLEIKKLLLKEITELEEFGYWNNTDKPEEVSDSHWSKREKIWNELLTSYSFSKSGFSTFDFFKSLDFLKNLEYTYDIFENVDYEKRKKDYVENQTINLVISSKDSKMNTYSKSRREVREGKHKEIEKKVGNHFEEKYIKVTKDNFNNIKVKSMKK